MEVSTNMPLSYNNIQRYISSNNILYLWLVPAVFEVILRVLQAHYRTLSLLSPFYFISIPPIFYIVLYITHIPVDTARNNGYFFDPRYVICVCMCILYLFMYAYMCIRITY